MFRRMKAMLYGLSIGAGLMYLYDPERGTRRRAMLRDRITHTLNRADDGIGKGSRDLSNRVQGLGAELQAVFEGRKSMGELLKSPLGENTADGWTPAARLVAGLAGGMLAVGGLRRGGLMGTTRGLFGVGLLARGITNRDFTALIGLSGDEYAVSIHKGLIINAPVEEVFSFWQNYANFPRFMEHVIEVRDMGNGHSHWVVEGPAGAPVEWDADITNLVANQLMAWESTPESQVRQAGVVRFSPGPEQNNTQLNVQMSYTPPAGIVGHVVASFFGQNPKQQMDDDLMRLKSLLEQGKTTMGGQTVDRGQVESNRPQSGSSGSQMGSGSGSQSGPSASNKNQPRGEMGSSGYGRTTQERSHGEDMGGSDSTSGMGQSSRKRESQPAAPQASFSQAGKEMSQGEDLHPTGNPDDSAADRGTTGSGGHAQFASLTPGTSDYHGEDLPNPAEETGEAEQFHPRHGEPAPTKPGSHPEDMSSADTGMPGGGQGRTDEVGPTGVFPASGPLPEDDAPVQGMGSWGQGERGEAGYEDHGDSELWGLSPDQDEDEDSGVDKL